MQVEHGVQVLLERIRDADGRFGQLDARRQPRVDVQHAALDLADLVEIVREPRAIGGRQVGAQ
ncbi:hypothetical protein D3C83_194890 [compost metagenome]